MSTAAWTQRYVAGTGTLGQWGALALGVSIPVSVALDNVLLAISLAAWLIGAQHRAKLALAWHNPVYRAALLLLGLLVLGTLYGNPAPGDAGLYLAKYLDLALIPVLGWAFIASRDRGTALRVLAGALAVTLLMSCALKAGLTPQKFWLHGTPEFPIVFKSRLTHNILMAFAAFLFSSLACSATTRGAKLGWSTLGALAVANVTLMVEGATGYVLLAALVLLFGWQRIRLRGIGIAAVAALLVVAALSVIPGPFQARVKQIFSEVKQERADRPASTSAGYRMEFYRNTLTLIGKNPVFGTGTGSFPAVYAEQVKSTGSVASKNPHNEFMLIAVQTGLVGLAALVWLLWQQWRLAPQLPTPLERGLAQGLVVTMVVICMLNSALLDHTEGLLYAWLTALLYAGLKSGDESRRLVIGNRYYQSPMTSHQLPTMRISVIVITKNAGATLRRCLESVTWAGEIIVVDSGSSDDTQDICGALGAKVTVTADWPGFGAQKNRALDLATGDWVFSIDADEWVTPALRDEMLAVIGGDAAAPAYAIPRRSSFCGRYMKHSGWWPDHVVRLFRREAARFSDDQAHERLVVNGAVRKLKQPLMHEAIADLDQMIAKMNLYSTASARGLHARGRRASIRTALLHGGWAFFRTYVLRAGFLDGREGLMLAIANAEGSYYRYVKLMLRGEQTR